MENQVKYLNTNGVAVTYTSVSQPFLSCVPPEPICHTMSTPMLMILKKYNVTQVIIKCFHVPPAVCLRTPRGTRTPGWESLTYTIGSVILTRKLQHCQLGSVKGKELSLQPKGSWLYFQVQLFEAIEKGA